MTDFTRKYETVINAPVHEVFEYCRDPRHLLEGWPELEVTEVDMTAEGVGTTAHIVATFAKGMVVEEVEREFTEFTPDERIVSTAHSRVRFLGRTRDVETVPIFTWLFAPTDGATTLTFEYVENIGWWQSIFEHLGAAALEKHLLAMLAAVKAGVEGQRPE